MSANNNPFMPGPGANISNMSAPMPGTSSTPSNAAFEVDLSDVQENSFTIPDGLYRMKLIEVEQGVSKGGNPMFIWTFEVANGPHQGFQSKVFTALTPAAMWKVAETVVALGVGQTGQVVKFKRSDVIGKECGALIEKTEYNNKVNSQISRVMTLAELAEQAQANS